ncbi:MAG: hypothetical protein RSB66_07415 [Clostridium sp.]
MNNSIFEDFLIVLLLGAACLGISVLGGEILQNITGMPYGIGFVVIPLCLIAGILMVLLIKFGDYIKSKDKSC